MIIKFADKSGIWHERTNSISFDLTNNTVNVYYENDSEDRCYCLDVTNAAEAQQAHFESLSAGERIFDLTKYQTTETKPK
jgi:hypothetical protein